MVPEIRELNPDAAKAVLAFAKYLAKHHKMIGSMLFEEAARLFKQSDVEHWSQ